MSDKSLFQPDSRHFAAVMQNRRPERLPLYEHIIDPEIMEGILDLRFAELANGGPADVREFLRHYCRFFREMTYDVVSFEICITDALPDHGALSGGRPGPIQDRSDFETYPWEELPELYWRRAATWFERLGEEMPEGMKAVGGIGNGVFEISEDLVGLEYLPFMQVDDPDLYRDLFRRLEEDVTNGRGLADGLLNADFVPSAAAEMVVTAERTGALGMVTELIGQHYEEEGEAKLRELVTILEPMIIVVMGVVVAVVVLSVMLPMFDLATLTSQNS